MRAFFDHSGTTTGLVRIKFRRKPLSALYESMKDEIIIVEEIFCSDKIFTIFYIVQEVPSQFFWIISCSGGK